MKSKIKSVKKGTTAHKRVAHAAAPKKAKPKAAVTPRYDAGLRYDSGLRYLTSDPPPPTGKAKVKLELSGRSDANIVGFGHAHIEAVTGNPAYPTPQPTPAVFAAKLSELEAMLAALENHRIEGRGLTDQRDVLRAEFELLFTQRGTYVELASGGDAALITSAGLPVRNLPTPAGVLPFPGNLRLDLGAVAGEMSARWMPVAGAKSYMLEMAEVINGVTGAFSLVYVGGKYSHRLADMVVGKTYAFRVCAIGGEGGRSAFSPEVWRAAA